MDPIRIATWNVSWAGTEAKHRERSRRRIEELDADILVLTETTRELLPDGGYFAKGGSDWGEAFIPGRLKVVLWSRWPITDASSEIDEPGGRHVRATVESPSGPVRVHSVCAPWSMAHVSGGRGDAEPWVEHLAFLAALDQVLAREAAEPGTGEIPLIIAGDVNQRDQPRPHGNTKAVKAWTSILEKSALDLATDETMIDRIVTGPGLAATDPRFFPPQKMSDDHAVSCLITPMNPPSEART